MGSIQRPLTSTRGSRTKKASGREDVQKGDAGQAAAQALKRTLIVRSRRRDSRDAMVLRPRWSITPAGTCVVE